MKIITSKEDANILLKSYADSYFQIVLYSESLKRIAIRLTLPNNPEVLYFLGMGCEKIQGFFSHPKVNLSIDIREEITTIKDVNLGFNLIINGGFSLAQGLESEFGTTFDNFIKR